MAKDEKNVPDGTYIQPEEKASDNIIQIPGMTEPQTGAEIPHEMSAEEAAILAQEGEAYAYSLIGMAEQRSKFAPLYNGFSKNAATEIGNNELLPRMDSHVVGLADDFDPLAGIDSILEYDNEMGIYRYNGKWVRSMYYEYYNSTAQNGVSAILSFSEPSEEIAKRYGTPIDLILLRDSQTAEISGVKIISWKTVKQLDAWLPFANEIDFETFVSNGLKP